MKVPLPVKQRIHELMAEIEPLQSQLTAANEKIARLERALAGEATEEMCDAAWDVLPRNGLEHPSDFVVAYKAMRDAALKEST